MDAVEYHRVVLFIVIDGFFEVTRVFGPMHGRMYVVADVITVVPALMIVFCVHTGYAVQVWIAGIIFRDKRMLSPIAHECHEAVKEIRDDKHYQSSLETDEAEGNAHQDKKKFTLYRSIV